MVSTDFVNLCLSYVSYNQPHTERIAAVGATVQFLIAERVLSIML